jgi:predicted nucleic acid-binding protein
MALLSSFSDQPSLLVADTSVVININATGCAEVLLKALPHRVVVVDVVVDEIEGGLRKGRQDSAKLVQLIKSGLIDVVKLGPRGLIHFENLVIGASEGTLDDGEAATIAYAADVGARALIEERKARRLAAERYAGMPLGCTVDLLQHIDVGRVLGTAGVSDAVHKALAGARMRVLPHHIAWVVSTIGDLRVAGCPCLPEQVRQQARVRLS